MNRLLPSDFKVRLRSSSNLHSNRRSSNFPGGYRVRTYLKFVFYILMITGTCLGGYVLYVKAMHFIGSSHLFALKEVEVQGYEHVLPSEIISASELTFGQNIFSIQLAKVRSNIMTIPWISSLSIRKSPPHKIDITVTERKAYCMILLDRMYYVDGNGIIFKKVNDRDSFNYPIITGFNVKDGDFMNVPLGPVTGAVSFIKELDQNSLIVSKDISELHVDNTGYTVITNDGFIIRFGTDNLTSRIGKLNAIISYFGDKVQMFSTVDLRFTGMGVIHYKPGFTDSTSLNLSLKSDQKEVNDIEKKG